MKKNFRILLIGKSKDRWQKVVLYIARYKEETMVNHEVLADSLLVPTCS